MVHVLRAVDGSGFLAGVTPAAGTDVVAPVATQDPASALRFDSEVEATWQAGRPGMGEGAWEVTIVNDGVVVPAAETVPEVVPETDVETAAPEVGPEPRAPFYPTEAFETPRFNAPEASEPVFGETDSSCSAPSA